MIDISRVISTTEAQYPYVNACWRDMSDFFGLPLDEKRKTPSAQ